MTAIQFSSTEYDKKHIKGLAKRQRALGVLFSEFCNEVAVVGSTIGRINADKELHLDNYPSVERSLKRLMMQLASDIATTIKDGNMAAWEVSEQKNAALMKRVGHSVTLPKDIAKNVKQSSETALEEFCNRKENGMNLSTRVWNLVKPLKEQMELALELGLSQGKGAAALSRDVHQYLQYPDKLFRRVRDKDGILRLSKAAASFHPGQGVYRSSYKNALRMTVTENNMAYRAADYTQWNEMPFVIGMEIGLSNNHPVEDICDELKCVYPKEFKFVGWHPFCRCFAVPKLADRKELNKWARMTDEERKGYTFNGTVKNVPKLFTTWVENNKGRIEKAKSLPYFIRDNKGIIENKSASADISVNDVVSIDSELTKLAKAVGVEIGEPMIHEQADMKHPNPHYGEDEQYRINCQSCVVAYEMRRRGLPVEAFGKIEFSNCDHLSKNTNAGWLNAKGEMPVSMIFQQTVKSRTVDRRGVVRKIYTQEKEVWKEFYAKTNEVGRYHIKWAWSNGDTGHIITMETFKDGTRRFYDPQTGIESATILPWAYREGKIRIDLKCGIYAYRVDTLQPNSLVVRGVVKKAGSKLATPKTDNEQRDFWFNLLWVKKQNGSTNGILKPLETKDVNLNYDNGGAIKVNPSRLVNANKNKQERSKFLKEFEMCKILAENSYKIEMLQEISGIPSCDILMNGVKTDLKCITGGAGNIFKYASHALREQNGDAVVFEIPDNLEEYIVQLQKANEKLKGKIYYYCKNERKIIMI